MRVEKAKVADEKRRGLPDKPGACEIADVGDSDTISDLPVICQVCVVRRAAKVCENCWRRTCTPCGLIIDGGWHLACGRRYIDEIDNPGSEAQVNSEMVALGAGDQSREEAVARECTAETDVSDDTSKFTPGGAGRASGLDRCR